MSESFTVVIRGGSTSNNRLSGDATNAVYNVEWTTVLPKKYKFFKLSSYFRNTPRSDLNTTDDDFVCVECTAFPQPYTHDNRTGGRGTLICIAPTYWIFTNVNPFFYNESNAGNCPQITVQYPVENTFQIRLTDLQGNTLTAARYSEWSLILNLTPVA